MRSLKYLIVSVSTVGLISAVFAPVYCWRKCFPRPRVVVHSNNCTLVKLNPIPVLPILPTSSNATPTGDTVTPQSGPIACMGTCLIETFEESFCGGAPLSEPCHDCQNIPAGPVRVLVNNGCSFAIVGNAATCGCNTRGPVRVDVGHDCRALVCNKWPC